MLLWRLFVLFIPILYFLCLESASTEFPPEGNSNEKQVCHALHVSGSRFPPLMYPDVSCRFTKGLENKLISTIATETHLEITYQSQPTRSKYDRLVLKRGANDNLTVGGSHQQTLNSPAYTPAEMFSFDQTEHIASYQPKLVMRNDFSLKSRVDEFIHSAAEGGRFIKWDRYSQRKKERIDSIDSDPTFYINDLKGYFVVILGAGYLMSTLTLFCEILIHKKMMQPRRRKIWRYLEYFFDGKRHILTDLANKFIKK